MTLKQAFTLWANAPKNIALAAKSRGEVQRVLMKMYSDIDLEQITESFARRIFEQHSNLPQETLTKAAAVLVYLLKWGAENGHCQAPTFDTSVAYVCLPEKPLSKEAYEHATMGEYANQKPAPVRNKRPVAQIDTKTLQVIKVWPSVTQAHNESHIKNIERAIERRGIAGGYFWCDEKDVATFKPAERKTANKAPKTKAAPKPKPKPDEVPVSVAAANVEYVPKFKVGDHVWAKKPKDLAGRTGYIKAIFNPKKEYDVAFGAELWIVPEDDLELVNEPVMTEPITKISIDALADFTDQQLIDELIRRGYKGTLSITKQITL